MTRTGVYFVHVPKTAGTSFRWMLEGQYPARRCCQIYPRFPGLRYHVPGAYPPIDAATAARIDCFSSHAPLGTFPALEARLATITMLREPIAREISLYSSSVPRPGFRRRELEGLTLSEYVDLMQERHQDNMQVRMLSGAGFSGEIGEDTLALACHTLRERIAAFGLTEWFTDSMTVFQRLCGWPRVRLMTRNITRRRAALMATPTDLQRRLVGMNRYDIRLYETAEALFHERMRKSPVTDEERRAVREAVGVERVVMYQQRVIRRCVRMRIPRSA